MWQILPQSLNSQFVQTSLRRLDLPPCLGREANQFGDLSQRRGMGGRQWKFAELQISSRSRGRSQQRQLCRSRPPRWRLSGLHLLQQDSPLRCLQSLQHSRQTCQSSQGSLGPHSDGSLSQMDLQMNFAHDFLLFNCVKNIKALQLSLQGSQGRTINYTILPIDHQQNQHLSNCVKPEALLHFTCCWEEWCPWQSCCPYKEVELPHCQARQVLSPKKTSKSC